MKPVNKMYIKANKKDRKGTFPSYGSYCGKYSISEIFDWHNISFFSETQGSVRMF